MTPFSTRSTTARVVSKRNSSIGRGRPNDVCSQHGGDVGWRSTRAPRRSSSRKTGSNDASPTYVPSMLVSSTKPSTSRWSQQYAISAMAASTSGSGSEASSPNRPGWSTTARRPSSFTSRARSTAVASSPRCTPGDETDSSDVRDAEAVHHRDVLVGRPLRDRGQAVGLVVTARAAARRGSRRGRSGRGRRSSRVEGGDPLEQRVDVEVGLGAVHRVPDGQGTSGTRPTTPASRSSSCTRAACTSASAPIRMPVFSSTTRKWCVSSTCAP